MAINGVTIFPYTLGHYSKTLLDELLDISIQHVCLEPRIEGDIFGQINFASLTVQCRKLKKLSSLEREPINKGQDILGGEEVINICLDTQDMEAIPFEDVFLLRILTFDNTKVVSQARHLTDLPLSGLTGLLLRQSNLGLDYYERIGRFWIDICPGYRNIPVRAAKLQEKTHKDANKRWNSNGEEMNNRFGNYKHQEGNGDEVIGLREKLENVSTETEEDNNQKDSMDEIDDEGRYKDSPYTMIQTRDERSEVKKDVKGTSFKDAIYRSLIWSKLEDAEMHQRAPHEEGCEEEEEERFIITLV